MYRCGQCIWFASKKLKRGMSFKGKCVVTDEDKAGIAMTKKGVPAKRQPCPREPVFQCNIEAINGQPYSYEFKNR